jgi:hypothetical protein
MNLIFTEESNAEALFPAGYKPERENSGRLRSRSTKQYLDPRFQTVPTTSRLLHYRAFHWN